MLPMQQLIKALRKLQNSGGNCGDLVKSIKHVVTATATTTTSNTTGAVAIATTTPLSPAATLATSLLSAHSGVGSGNSVTSSSLLKQQQQQQQQEQLKQQQLKITNSSQQKELNCQTSQTANVSLISHLNENSSTTAATTFTSSSSASGAATKTNVTTTQDSNIVNTTTATPHHLHRSQQIQNFYQQQLHHFHTQHNQSLYAKQKQTQANAMSSLAAEPLTLSNNKQDDCHNNLNSTPPTTVDANADDEKLTPPSGSSSGKPCFNTGLGEILQFMELIGNLKHTKRTGWVLRDVNDCESISGHMYRMSMMTFLLDGTEGLNQIRCMELALVHDLAESLVGDITPFCGISKEEKRGMEFKAMEDICKLIEPRGKRIMELFEEYEHGQSPESRFVKDLDRLDMVMQAFEYEKRDNCLLKHQEFFDSTAGKFNHPFVKKLVAEIYEQRKVLAKAKGATPPPVVHVPNMDLPVTAATNGHATAAVEAAVTSSSSSSS